METKLDTPEHESQRCLKCTVLEPDIVSAALKN